MKLIGMNCTLMKQYIEFVADRLMLELGFSKVKYRLQPSGSSGTGVPYLNFPVHLFRFSE